MSWGLHRDNIEELKPKIKSCRNLSIWCFYAAALSIISNIPLTGLQSVMLSRQLPWYHENMIFVPCCWQMLRRMFSSLTRHVMLGLFTLSGGPGMPICEGFSLPLATNMALILAATAAAASRAPVGAASASPVPPEAELGPGWSHLLRRLGGQKNMTGW